MQELHNKLDPAVQEAIEAKDLNPIYYDWHDRGNGDYCVDLLNGQFLYTSAQGWLTFNGSYWNSADAELILGKRVMDALYYRYKAVANMAGADAANPLTPSVAHTNSAINRMTHHLVSTMDDFDKSPDLLNARNGYIDLRDGTKHATTPADKFTYAVDTAYDPSADYGPWAEFVYDICGRNPQKVNYLQRAIGYSLTGHTKEDKFFYIQGPTRSGKSTFLNTLATVLGHEPIAASVGFSTFANAPKSDSSSFDLAPLKSARLVISSESGPDQRLDNPYLKRITGGDRIRCAYKYGDTFAYQPTFKVWFASNEPLRAYPGDGAFWARAQVIEFPVSYRGREDQDLDKKLLHHRSGILRWAVEGAMQWYERGLDTPDIIKHATRTARRSSPEYQDPMQRWVAQHVRPSDPDAFVTNEALKRSYRLSCLKYGCDPKAMRSITRALKDRGYPAGKQKKIDGNNTRGCFGIELVGHGNRSLEKS